MAPIAGNLNFGSVPAQNDYQSAYANALSLNQQNYSNILAGYQGTMQGQQQAQQGIQQGYGNLSGQVMGDISGIDASQRQAIADTYAQNAGTAAQGLISRGLGNTTVANSVQRGLSLDKAKADIALTNQTQQLTAGYRSQLGLAGLNYANQANMQNTGLAGQQLGFMNSVNSPYPNAKNYADASLQQQTLALARQGMNRGQGGYGGLGGGGVSGMNSGRGFGFGGVGGGAGGGGSIQQSGGYMAADQYSRQARAPQAGSNQMIDTNGNVVGQAGPTDAMERNPYVFETSSGGNGGNDPGAVNSPTIGSNPAGIAGQAGQIDQGGGWDQFGNPMTETSTGSGFVDQGSTAANGFDQGATINGDSGNQAWTQEDFQNWDNYG